MIEDLIREVGGTIRDYPLAAYYIAVAALAWPMVKVFRRAGFRPHEVLWLLFPLLGYVITLGFLVFRPWPVLPPRVRKVKS